MKYKKTRIYLLVVIWIFSTAIFSGCAFGRMETSTPLPEQTPLVHTQELLTPEQTEQPEHMDEKTQTPAPSKEPAPVAEQELPPAQEAQAEQTEKTPVCTILVRCDSVLRNLDKLAKEKRSIIPSDGMIFPKTKVSFSDGDSVFDVLKREMRNYGIPLEFVDTPIYHSAYVEGIGNLYEFDCGDTSGWTYMVNGESPNYGCSQYQVKENDAIEFVYRCSLFEE